MVRKRQNRLEVYNPIYEAIFNLDWINYQLENKCLYSNELKAWLQSNQDKSFLIQGETLEKAQEWAKEKI